MTMPSYSAPLGSRLVRGLGRALRAVYLVPAFYATLLVLGCVQLAWSFVAFVLWHVAPRRHRSLIGRRFVSRLYRYCFRVTSLLGLLHVDARSLDALDAGEGLVIAANHPSVLDALILISRLEKLNCIMKASVLDNVFLGAGARLAGYIRNDGPKRMLRLSTHDLKEGGQLIIFPEGTRTVAVPVNAFKCGFAAMARLADVPIQTVIIETDTPYLSKGWSILKMPPRLPMRFRIRVGRRFAVDGEINEFVDRLRTYFVDELEGAEPANLRDHRAAGVRQPALHDEPIALDEWRPVASTYGDERLVAARATVSSIARVEAGQVDYRRRTRGLQR